MKRDLALRELSVDHHHGLVQAGRLQAAAANAAQTAQAFLQFWASDMREHFSEEEQILIPAWARRSAGADSAPVHQMIMQHMVIRGFVMELQDQVQATVVEATVLNHLGKLLEEHIHLEERVIFNSIQQDLSPEALLDIGERIACARKARHAG